MQQIRTLEPNKKAPNLEHSFIYNPKMVRVTRLKHRSPARAGLAEAWLFSDLKRPRV
jgi:hypothetical protein